MGAALPVESVSDTALLTAFCRAVETERPDARFSDPFARRLAGERGEQLLKRFSGGELTVDGCTVRTSMLDELIVATIKEANVDTVVNLGAGLDTRPYRLPSTSHVSWIEVDNSEMIAHKTRVLEGYSPVCASLESVPMDIADVDARRILLARIAAAAVRVLVLTEGLLIYMTPDEVASLACDLHRSPQFRWWLTDIVSPSALVLMQSRYCESPNTGNVQLMFAPENGPQFFHSYGWETIDRHSCLEEGQRLNRSFLSAAFLSADLSRDQQQILLNLYTIARLCRVEPSSVG